MSLFNPLLGSTLETGLLASNYVGGGACSRGCAIPGVTTSLANCSTLGAFNTAVNRCVSVNYHVNVVSPAVTAYGVGCGYGALPPYGGVALPGYGLGFGGYGAVAAPAYGLGYGGYC